MFIYDIMMKPIYIYFHICCINNWEEVVSNMIDQIKSNGLYDIVKEIRCSVLGECNVDEHPLFSDPKIIIIYRSLDKSSYEREILKHLQRDSDKEDFYVLNLHSKGVTRNRHKYITDWVDLLLHFNLKYHAKVIQLLQDGLDTVGVNLQGGELSPATPLHYSGNFWWSKSSYIKTLSSKIGPNYCDPEFWLCQGKMGGKHACLWKSNVNHYHQPYDQSLYLGKGIQLLTVDRK